MINCLFGNISAINTPFLFLRSGDIEWCLEVNERCISRLKEKDSPLAVYTWIKITDEQIYAFGFSSPQARHCFHELRSVSGIGPRQAGKILSHIDVPDVWRGIRDSKIALFSSVPGLGRKKTERLLIQLKDRIPEDISFASTNPYTDLRDTLLTMGYTAIEIDLAYRSLEDNFQSESDLMAAIIRQVEYERYEQ